MREEETLGALARRQVADALNTAPLASKPTLRMLRRGLPVLERAIECLCPAAAQMTAAGVQTAYGPYVGGATGQTYVMVTSDNAHLSANFDMTKLPPIPTEALKFLASGPEHRATVWAHTHDAIEAGDAGLAIVYLNALAGENGRQVLANAARSITAKGLYPIVWAIAAKTKERAAGCTGVLALPPTIELTFADVPTAVA